MACLAFTLPNGQRAGTVKRYPPDKVCSGLIYKDTPIGGTFTYGGHVGWAKQRRHFDAGFKLEAVRMDIKKASAFFARELK